MARLDELNPGRRDATVAKTPQSGNEVRSRADRAFWLAEIIQLAGIPRWLDGRRSTGDTRRVPEVTFRFHGSLNDFLPPARRGTSFRRAVPSHSSLLSALQHRARDR